MELGVGQPDHDAHEGLLCEWALLADLVEPLDDELPGLVEVLDTLGVVDEDVGAADGVYLPHQVLIEAVCCELVADLLGVLVPDGAVTELALPHGLDDLGWQWLGLDVEPVVAVGGLPLERRSVVLGLDAFPVDDDRVALLDLDAVLLLEPVDGDLQVELAHAGQEGLARLAVRADGKGCVGLREAGHRADELRQVLHGERLDGLRDHWLRVVPDGLEGRGLRVADDGDARCGAPDARDGGYVASGDRRDGDPVPADHHGHLLDPLCLGTTQRPDALALLDLA